MFPSSQVEAIREKLNLRDRTLVSVLAYSGPRPEEVGCRLSWGDVGQHVIRYVDTKRHRVRFTPLLEHLADDLDEWFAASGRPPAKRPVFPAHDGEFWPTDDWRNWRNWRRRIWQGEPVHQGRDRPTRTRAHGGCASGRHPSERPQVKLGDASRLRGHPANPTRPRGRNQRPDDRATLRRGDRELGRKASARRQPNSCCASI